MAYQHFFSRVPAKISMFNRTDGPDTFACSEKIAKPFIDKELSQICDFKPKDEEAALIRANKLPPVYFQGTNKEKVIFQTCMKFIPKDFTGERSTFLSHTLVLKPEEAYNILYNDDTALLNKEMFDKNIEDFDITNRNSPLDDYPEVDYVTAKSTENFGILLQNKDITQKFIFAVLNVICGNYKSLVFSLPETTENLSLRALELINNIAQIIPYNLRSYITFATYAGDFSKYSNYKIRCVPENIKDKPGPKQVYIRFCNIVTDPNAKNYGEDPSEAKGIKDNEFRIASDLTEFFYSLIKNTQLRSDFLKFYDNIITAMPETAGNNWKHLCEIVLLFRASQGQLNNMTVLPDDNSVTEFIGIYEKYRMAMADSARLEALSCFRRYPKSHGAIPQKAFLKIQKIYESEPEEVRLELLSVVLELIHTDLMRGKLFSFIKCIYQREKPLEKEKIIQNIIGVFYGGFLQSEIIEFFDDIFDSESDSIRDDILDKMFLCIRTEDIAKEIICFIDKHFDEFSDKSKENFYAAFLELMTDGNQTAKQLISLVDRKLPSETQDFKAGFCQNVIEALTNEQNKKDHRDFVNIYGEESFIFDITAKHLLGDWNQGDIYKDFVKALQKMHIAQMMSAIYRVLKAAPENDGETASRLSDDINSGLSARTNIDLFIKEYLKLEDNLKQLNTQGATSFIKTWNKKVLPKVIEGSITNLFTEKAKTGVPDRVYDVAGDKKLKLTGENWKNLQYYVEMKRAITFSDFVAIQDLLEKMPEDEELKEKLGSFMKRELEEEALDDVTEIIGQIVTNIFVDGSPKYQEIFTKTADFSQIINIISLLSETISVKYLLSKNCGFTEMTAYYAKENGKTAFKAVKEIARKYDKKSALGKALKAGLRECKKQKSIFSLLKKR